MNTIKIKFSGMGGHFNENDNFIINLLRKRYDVVFSDEPDYLFYSVLSSDYLNYNCVRIFYTAENLVPDFNICDYAIGFHYLNFEDRYIRFPLYLVDGFIAYDGDNYATDLERALHKHETDINEIKSKESFCSFVYSNAEAARCREKFFEAISKYKGVNSGGRYLNNVGGPIASKLEFQIQHKFVIAFENTSTPGYTTEKIVHAFSANAIPIYWGNPEIEKEFNGKSFINCHRYGLSESGEKEAIDRIVEEIIAIDNDDTLFMSYIKEPAFTDNNNVKEQQEKLQTFLWNIFDQPKENAYRRNRFYWGERYERKQRIGNKFYWTLRKAIPIRDKMKRILHLH